MNLIKKLAIGAATVSLAAGSIITPVFADADATNENVEDHSIGKAKAEDNDVYVVVVKNMFTKTKTKTVVIANTGGNVQGSYKGDSNKQKTGAAFAKGESNVSVNYTEINL